MALALFDRVQETTTTTGTGSLTLAGAVSGFQSFAVVGDTNTCYYTIVDGSAWEVGIGTYSTGSTGVTQAAGPTSGSWVTDGSLVGSNITWYSASDTGYAVGDYVLLLDQTAGSSFFYSGQITLIQFAGGFGFAFSANMLSSGGTPNGSPSSSWIMQETAVAPILARTTILSNSNADTSPITLTSGSKPVFLTYPAEKSVNLDSSGNVSPLGTVASGTWQGATVGVAYGGTGVVASSGANSVMIRDANQNVSVNRLNQANTQTTAAGGTTTLTAASTYSQTLKNTGSQTFQMPDATTLSTGVAFIFNNNATGLLTLQDYAAGAIGTITSGGAGELVLLDNSTVGGTWDVHGFLPEAVTWGTNALDLGTTVVTGGTWNGGTVTSAYGGTGLTTFAGSNNALYSTGASTLTAGTLPVVAGGTGTTTPSIVAGTNISVSGTWPNQTINNTASPVACATPTVAGIVFGKTQTCGAGGNVSLGNNTAIGTGNGNIAIGTGAGGGSGGSVAIGFYNAGSCGQGTGAIAIGKDAVGGFQTANSIVINALAPCSGSGISATAAGLYVAPIRNSTCAGGTPVGLGYCTTTKEIVYGVGGSTPCATPTVAGIVYGRTNAVCGQVALGFCAGASCQGAFATAIGQYAGGNGQGASAVAIGGGAGGFYQQPNAIAIGPGTACAMQGGFAVAIGSAAAGQMQGTNAVAIGAYAGQNFQGGNAIAIGYNAGKYCQIACSIAIGKCVAAPAAGLYIAPVRSKCTAGGSPVGMGYCTTSKEIVYGVTAAPRTSTTTSTATLTPDIALYDQMNLTAQAVGLTVAAPTGTPVDGTKLIFRILDNGTSQAITWNGTYTVIGTTLPTATVASKMLYVGCIYNSTNTRWDIVAVTTQV